MAENEFSLSNANDNQLSSQAKTRCLKFSLMVCNSFGIVIGFFVVLFGLAYSGVTFPGGFNGHDTALFAIGFILFSFVGYCGAHRLSFWLLSFYGVVIFLMLVSSILKLFYKADIICIEPKSYAIIFISTIFVTMMIFSFILSHKLRRLHKLQAAYKKSQPPTPAFSKVNLQPQPQPQQLQQPQLMQQPLMQQPIEQQQLPPPIIPPPLLPTPAPPNVIPRMNSNSTPPQAQHCAQNNNARMKKMNSATPSTNSTASSFISFSRFSSKK